MANYWTSSGTYDSIFTYIKGNIADVRNDLVFMVSGEKVPARIQQYAATANELHTKDQIYSAMVVYGLLTYEDGKVFIPNKELMEKFDELLLSNQNLGYVYRLAKESARMLQATLHGDTDTMEEILEYVHDTEVPIYSYNNEVELSAIVNLVYLSAEQIKHKNYKLRFQGKLAEETGISKEILGVATKYNKNFCSDSSCPIQIPMTTHQITLLNFR